jgi:hypothetical protein
MLREGQIHYRECAELQVLKATSFNTGFTLRSSRCLSLGPVVQAASLRCGRFVNPKTLGEIV